MSELKAIERNQTLLTKDDLMEEFRIKGIHKGMSVIVHSSLNSLGWVCGGAETVVQALMETITDKGTIVMPTQSASNSDPSFWENPPVPKDWWDTIRNHMPAYNPITTPTRGMGQIVESFRQHPGVFRSQHPMVSFSAWGSAAEEIVHNHSIDFPFGEQSPLARLYERESYVLLLGVGYDNCTVMHLAENRLPNLGIFSQWSAMEENGVRVWREFLDKESNSDRFPIIGDAFEKHVSYTPFTVGDATCRLIQINELVDFTFEWLKKELSNSK